MSSMIKFCRSRKGVAFIQMFLHQNMAQQHTLHKVLHVFYDHFCLIAFLYILIWLLLANTGIRSQQIYIYIYTTELVHWRSLLICYIAISIVTLLFTLLCYYGNVTNSLLCNRHCHVTMEM
jgi:hypothetical protein